MTTVLTTAARARIVNRQLSGPHLSRRMATLACATILAWVMACAPWIVQAAEDTETLEQRVKAAFLYKFAGYVEWPAKSFARPETPVVIGVMGNELLAAELIQAVTGRTVNDRLVTVKRLKAGDSLAVFLHSFPSVTRKQAVAALELALAMTEAHATAGQ